jgi:TusE/DsrC/DsvC family sulfur relay protein
MNKYNEAGYLIDSHMWSEITMHEIANREGINLNAEMIKYILSARELYEQNGTVPVLREFSKIHGGDRKGKIFDPLFHGGTMKKISMLGGLPQPTGCV